MTLKRFRLWSAMMLLSISSFAQSDYSGNWVGAIELPGYNLELSIHLQKEKGDWQGFMDIPAQKAKDLLLSDLMIKGLELRFKLPGVPGNASFSGNFDDKAEKVTGTFSQSGQQFPMRLTRQSAIEKASESKKTADALAALHHLVDSLREKRHMVGMAMGIIKDGAILMNEGFGYRDLDKKQAVTPQTMFAIGSSTKAFTAAGLAILADQGLLDWEKPVIEYMPDFKLYDPFSTQAMNAVDLCCHRSGLPRHDLVWYGSSLSREQIYQRLRYLRPNKSLRTTWQYNNLMFMTAGRLTEKLSGKTWEVFIREQIFEPLGMNKSHFSVEELKKGKDVSLGYSNEGLKSRRLDYRNLDAIGPAGSINSNATDMLKWVQFQLNEGKVGNKQLLSAAEMQHMHRPQMLMENPVLEKYTEITDPSYGLGWMLYRYKGLHVVEHGGNIDGFTALVYMIPEKNFGLVILSNQNGATLPGLLARYATDMLLNLETTNWYTRVYGSDDGEDEPEDKSRPEQKRVPGTQPSHLLKDYAGEYENPGYGRMVVAENNQALRVRFNSFDLPLEHWHYDVFHAVDSILGIGFSLNFTSDMNGNIDRFNCSMDPSTGDELFIKAPPARLSDPEFLRSLSGTYTLEAPGAATCNFELRQQTLYAKIAGQPEYTLVPFQGTEFKMKDLSGYSVEFVLNAESKPEAARFIQPNGIFTAKKSN